MRLKKTLAVSAAVCAMLCLIFAPAAAIESARYGLSLCAELIVPSLLPFFTASALLIRLGLPQTLGRALSPLARRLWGVSGAGASVFFAGICGGYPLGAQSAAELYLTGQVKKDEAETLLRFCNNSGPSFLIGVIGSSLFSSRSAGILLYLTHTAAALLTGVLFRRRSAAVFSSVPQPLEETCIASSAPQPSEETGIAEAFTASVRQAVSAVLSVCGFVACFCVLSGLLDALGLWDIAAAAASRLVRTDPQDLRALLMGLLELSSGVGALRGLPLTPARFVLVSFLCGWGGLSVQFQTMAVLAETDLDVRPHLVGRIFSALLSCLLSFALTRFFPLLPFL